MPNHVTNKIVFDANHAATVFPAVCPHGDFNFALLIPPPPHIYTGNLSREDGEDFKCNWATWNTENWGTKWNAYDCETGIVDGKAFIAFDTAWSIPYPVVSAFNNRFQIPFTHRYFDEGHNFWGVEEWGVGAYEKGLVTRILRRRDDPADKRALCVELKGYDPAEAA